MQKRVALKDYWLILAASIALAVGLNHILMILDVAKFSPAYQEAVKVLYAPPFGQQLLYTGLLIPIIEELIFRGLVFKVMRKWAPFVVTMIVSAFLFGIYHGNLVQFLYAGICGLWLAYLYEKEKSIVVPIALHMCMNITSCTMTEFGIFTLIFKNPVSVWGITIGCILVFLISFFSIQKLDVTKMLKKYCKE